MNPDNVAYVTSSGVGGLVGADDRHADFVCLEYATQAQGTRSQCTRFSLEHIWCGPIAFEHLQLISVRMPLGLSSASGPMAAHAERCEGLMFGGQKHVTIK